MKTTILVKCMCVIGNNNNSIGNQIIRLNPS